MTVGGVDISLLVEGDLWCTLFFGVCFSGVIADVDILLTEFGEFSVSENPES
jgi:hypothetical protein